MPRPMIAIVGRPNVGKSTLFNRLLHRRVSIEDDRSGVTRDRIAEDYEWNGVAITLVDTGGLMMRGVEIMDKQVSAAAEAAILAADKVVVVCDGRVGPSTMDEEVARLILRAGIPHLLAVTKLDTTNLEVNAYDFLNLGLGEPQPVSGVSGLNTGDLLDRIVEGFEPEDQSGNDDVIRLSVVGRPNVGKSSIVNRILGEDRQDTQEVRANDSKGRHTTVSRDLIVLPQGGMIIDNPGIREIQLASDEDALEEAFADVIEIMTHCRFRDCTHDHEPGCAVQDAIASETLDVGRLGSYYKLRDEIIVHQKKREQRAQAEARRKKQSTRNKKTKKRSR